MRVKRLPGIKLLTAFAASLPCHLGLLQHGASSSRWLVEPIMRKCQPQGYCLDMPVAKWGLRGEEYARYICKLGQQTDDLGM